MSVYSKRAVVLEMLDQGDVLLVIDGKRPGVCVPEDQKMVPLLLLYGHGLATPIPDLEVGEDGVSATLSFNRSPIPTFVPWSAVVGAIQQGRIQISWETADVEAADEPKKPALSLVRGTN